MAKNSSLALNCFKRKVQLFWEGHKNLAQSSSRFWRYLVMSKPWGRLRQISVAFSEKLNFNIMLTAFLKGWVMSGYEMLTAWNCLLFKKPINFGRLFVVIDFLFTVCTDIWNASTASNQSWYQQCFGKSYLSKGQ